MGDSGDGARMGTSKETSADKWGPDEVAEWFRRTGHTRIWESVKAEAISGQDLITLTREDWKDLLGSSPGSSYSVVDLRRMLCKIEELKAKAPLSIIAASQTATGCATPSPLPMVQMAAAVVGSNLSEPSDPSISEEDLLLEDSLSHDITNNNSVKNQKVLCPYCRQQKILPRFQLKPERWKAVLAFLYVLMVSWLTAFVMVIVHDRVPDMETYPPLPDILLDNIPHIPWAFEMCEVSGMTLLVVWLLVVTFHKHRFILLRRFFSISGTIFLLRCVTMLITSLSVPGKHLECAPRPYGDIYNKLYNAFVIWTGAGLTLQGVRTCGDYMFSGHTVGLTLLNFFITEYTSRKLYMLHTFTWICNVFGVFFILAAHEHYSIDVFVAFYITSRLFMYYHTLANQQQRTAGQDESSSLPTLDKLTDEAEKTWFWFPLFSFFESGVNGGKIPNEFEWPMTIQDCKVAVSRVLSWFEDHRPEFPKNSPQAEPANNLPTSPDEYDLAQNQPPPPAANGVRKQRKKFYNKKKQ